MNKQNQIKIWDQIAEKWNEYREVPSPTVIDFLKNKTGKVLDLGCGSGRNFSALNKKAEIICQDFSKQMLKHAENKANKLKLNAQFIHSPSNKINLKDNEVDSAICIALLHCIPEKKQRQETINELFRVLKPKSQVLISVWSRNSPRLRNKPKECFIPWTVQTKAEGKIKQERYTYIYDKEELEKEVKNSGFKILESWQERNINIVAEK